MTKVRALLVGIDEYAVVRHLSGCVADIKAVEALLKRRVPSDDLSLEVLLDGAAQRSAIIETFRRHLGVSAAGEVALFYFAGHGSQEPCPKEWARSEADQLDETLVCVDSRSPGVWDLADKEINALIAEAGANGAHVLTIFDSCHSGGVTRAVDEVIAPSVRMAPAVRYARPMSSYLDAARSRYDAAASAATATPEPPHIALSACQPHQTAKELPLLGTHRGAFSVALEENVELLGEGATYVDVATAIRASLRTRVSDQAPDLYSAGGASSTTPFLGGAIQPRSLTVNRDGNDWWLSAGAIDGITDPGTGGTVEVELFDRASPPNDGGLAVAGATVSGVEPSRSKLEVVARAGHVLDEARQYVAVITAVGTAALRIVVSGSEASTVITANAGVNPLVVMTTTPPEGSSDVRTLLLEVDGGTVGVRGGAGAEITRPFDSNREALDRLTADIAHLAKWHSLLDRVAPGSRLGDAVVVDLLELTAGQQTADDDQPPVVVVARKVTLAYDGDTPPRVVVRLTNTSDRRLYAALYDLTDSYASGKMFADWIEPRSSAWMRGGQVQKLTIPEWMPGARQVTDRLKLIVSTDNFDADAWTMPRLVGPATRGADRDIGDETFGDPLEDDGWGTSLLEVVTTRD